MNYKTPGVYVEEIVKFPPSVAQVETAIPAFIGYTQKGPKGEPTRISSLMEYETLFGGAEFEKQAITLDVLDGVATATVTAASLSDFKLYYALQMYFANGGGPCYIVAVNHYKTGTTVNEVKFNELIAGLDLLEKEDEPTLVMFTEAEALLQSEVYSLYISALNHAEKMGDRFVIMDVIGDLELFRTGVEAPGLKYGAAYHPKLETVLSYNYKDEDVTISSYKITLPNGSTQAVTNAPVLLSALKGNNSALYNQAKKAIAAQRIVLAPSSAIAGVYAKVDSTSGVWKAPANIGLNYVVAPVEKISHKQQESLNVDAKAGKSINAIRTFTGKGTLVWGARTLDGNSNEWRYVSVRRFFNMVEESVKNATERFVFDANDAKTWTRVKAMIENFLNQQWMSGALAGSTPEQAYYVSVGLNETMSAQDILEGRMIVEIGMAAVRPAEFIVLRFSHKLQEA
ncbi:phage tail sheath family protein [Flavobacterium sp. UBA4197]|uniref:phage tail sheath family protein n=1 Tax=Flavobacterium sp. UBA4197 TaxID=1946546 RepID=UPI00257BDB78|nr:phage tail sheath C-terminal domain-containing protein [Flavobacterium sp. UBA4197]